MKANQIGFKGSAARIIATEEPATHNARAAPAALATETAKTTAGADGGK